jgi:hypothetical protein
MQVGRQQAGRQAGCKAHSQGGSQQQQVALQQTEGKWFNALPTLCYCMDKGLHAPPCNPALATFFL